MKNGITEVGGKFYRKCKIVMLPTEKSKILLMYKNIPETRYLFLNDTTENNFVTDKESCEPQHLYFLSDEIIQGESVWHYNHVYNTISNDESSGYKKIIATTDKSLSKGYCVDRDPKKKSTHTNFYTIDGLPRPSNEFLQAYCKANGKIDEVLVEYDEKNFLNKKERLYEEQLYYDLKVAKDNTITIKPIKKKTYSETEVKELIWKAIQESKSKECKNGKCHNFSLEDFCNKNL